MRASMRAGVLLAVAAALVVVLSAAWGLDIEAYALAGVAFGGVIALVPDRSAWARLGAFVIGFVAAWIGFVLRAALLPDATSGVAVAAAATILIGLIGVAAGRGRHVPLWAVLVGAGAFSASYESAFSAAPPEVVNTSANAATSLLLAVAVGFVVTCLSAPRATAPTIEPPQPRDGEAADQTSQTEVIL
jgi:hypothetical protein